MEGGESLRLKVDFACFTNRQSDAASLAKFCDIGEVPTEGINVIVLVVTLLEFASLVMSDQANPFGARLNSNYPFDASDTIVVSQASLTVVWSLLGVGAWVLGSRRRNRQVWMGGALLMAIVLLKLLLVDRGYMGNMPGIVSFMAVGLLLVGVGYIAPSPPKLQQTGDSA